MVQTWDFLSKIMEHGDSSIFHQWLEHGSWGTVSHPNSRKLFDSMGNVPLGQSHGAVITLLANWGSMFGVQSVWPLGKSSIHLLVTRWCWMQVSLDLWPCCLENEDLNLKLHTHTHFMLRCCQNCGISYPNTSQMFVGFWSLTSTYQS